MRRQVNSAGPLPAGELETWDCGGLRSYKSKLRPGAQDIQRCCALQGAISSRQRVRAHIHMNVCRRCARKGSLRAGRGARIHAGAQCACFRVHTRVGVLGKVCRFVCLALMLGVRMRPSCYVSRICGATIICLSMRSCERVRLGAAVFVSMET